MASLASHLMTVRDREDGAFDRLFVMEYGKVAAIAHRILGDVHEAEDVAQEVFCAFHGRHDPEAYYAPAWLHRAAAHTALNVLRGANRRKRRERTDALERDRVQVVAEMGLDPQRAVEMEESRREVRAALARLPEKSAAVLALRYSGLSYAEVAAALGVGVGQIGTLLRRAEAAFRKEMNREASC